MTPRNAKQQTYDLGLKAEKWACLILRLKGFRILEVRYKTPVGEVDIIARHKQTLVFVEVKARQTMDQALYSLTPSMRQRIGRGAEYFLSSHPEWQGKECRFDMFVFLNRTKWHHIPNAWDMA